LARQIAGDQFLGDLVRALPAGNTVTQVAGSRMGRTGSMVVGIAVDHRDKVQDFAGQFKIDFRC